MAKKLGGRTDNDIKNHWHTNLKKRFDSQMATINNINPTTHNSSSIITCHKIVEANWNVNDDDSCTDEQVKKKNDTNNNTEKDEPKLLLNNNNASLSSSTSSSSGFEGVNCGCFESIINDQSIISCDYYFHMDHQWLQDDPLYSCFFWT